MSVPIRINLHNIPETLKPGDVIKCTAGGHSHTAHFVEHAAQGAMFGRLIIVQIDGLREMKKGVVRVDMFESLTDRFFVNSDRHASTSYVLG